MKWEEGSRERKGGYEGGWMGGKMDKKKSHELMDCGMVFKL